MVGAEASWSAREGGGPMDLDALRYTWFVTSPLQGNVQFDRHPTEGGGGFSALREYRAPSARVQSKTREAQPMQSGGLFGIDVTGGLFVCRGEAMECGDR